MEVFMFSLEKNGQKPSEGAQILSFLDAKRKKDEKAKSVSFEEVMKNNKKNKDRESQERKEANKKVLKALNMAQPKKP
jgi:hypothetical protein